MNIEDVILIVSETMNMLEHEYGVTELDMFGIPTVEEISEEIMEKHYAS